MTEPQRNGLSLTPFQHRLITTALAGLSLFIIFALLFGLFLLLRSFVGHFSGVLLPLAIAGILAMLLRPVVGYMEENSRLNRTGGVIVLYFLVVLVLAVGLFWIIPIILEQTVQMIRSIPAIYEGLREILAARFPQLLNYLKETVGEQPLTALAQEFEQRLSQNVQSLLLSTAAVGRDYFFSVFSTAAAAAIVPVYLFFFLRSGQVSRRQIEQQLSWVRKDIREDIIYLGHQFATSLGTFFQGQIVIGLIMGGLLAFGFSVAGIHLGFAVGIAIGLLNIIPYLGTVLGLATVLPIAWFQPEGGPVLVLIALGVFMAVQLVEGYFLTPKIMGNRTGLHPLTIIIAIFFWGTALNGLLGMILAIPLTAFFVVAWRLFREKYLKAWTTGTETS